jgi:hypothetical protein
MPMQVKSCNKWLYECMKYTAIAERTTTKNEIFQVQRDNPDSWLLYTIGWIELSGSLSWGIKIQVLVSVHQIRYIFEFVLGKPSSLSQFV